MKLYCVCQYEWCWCTELVEVSDDELDAWQSAHPEGVKIVEGGLAYVSHAPDKACTECAQGKHVLSPFSARRSLRN